MFNQKIIGGLKATAAGGLLLAFGAGAQAAQVYVGHGIAGDDLGLAPELPVDVSVNGACVLEGFTFTNFAGPLELAAGSYDIDIALANEANPCSESPVISATVPFTDDETATVIAHLTDGGAPTASKFVNDLSDTSGRKARIAVRHTANAPTVDVNLTRIFPLSTLTIEDLSNPNEAAADVRPGWYAASIFPANSGQRVFGPIPLRLNDNQAYFVYAVGTLANGTFTLLIQELATDQPSDIYVIHGIPGQDLGADPTLPVDVAVDGTCLLQAFTFGDIAGPVPLTEGTYNVQISLADAGTPCSNAPVIDADVPVDGGENATIIAHLAEDGSPTATKFFNRTNRPFAANFGRVTVRHTAAAGAVNVSATNPFRRAFFRNISNTQQRTKTVRQGNYQVAIRPVGSGTPVLGPLPVRFEADTGYFVYAVGTPGTGSFDLIVQTQDLH